MSDDIGGTCACGGNCGCGGHEHQAEDVYFDSRRIRGPVRAISGRIEGGNSGSRG